MMEDMTECAECYTTVPIGEMHVLREDSEYPEMFCRDCWNKLGTPTPAPLRKDNPAISPRAHFAALAMQGILASETEDSYYTPERAASIAVKYADDLLAALGGGKW